jgi:hypothetical protein
MNRVHAAFFALVFLLSGCASTGQGLIAGQSTAADVVAKMGQPAERLPSADGDTVWFYPNQPFGRVTYAVRVAPDGRVRSVEQVLDQAHIARIVAGETTRAQVRETFGPPYLTTYLPRQQREVWTWALYNLVQDPFLLHVQMSDDGIVREVLMLEDRQARNVLFFRF